jgi:ABC transport system ATP-binding/permease protein
MAILRLEAVGKQIQGQTLFKDVDLTIEPGERLGVIGVNGCGKTTLLKIIAGEVEADWGKVTITPGYRVAYLSQLPRVDGTLTIGQAVYQSQRAALEAYEEYQELCSSLGDDSTEADYKKLDRLTNVLEKTGFYDLQVRADTAIQNLGLAELTALVGDLSGGQRRRVDLAQALTSEPDLLLLDEPTNHLDPQSVDWLESYLQEYRGAVLMITHDRYFLDRVTRRTLEIDNGQLTSYTGNYATYLEKKAELNAQAEANAAKRANIWRRELEWLRRGPKRAPPNPSRVLSAPRQCVRKRKKWSKSSSSSSAACAWAQKFSS